MPLGVNIDRNNLVLLQYIVIFVQAQEVYPVLICTLRSRVRIQHCVICLVNECHHSLGHRLPLCRNVPIFVGFPRKICSNLSGFYARGFFNFSALYSIYLFRYFMQNDIFLSISVLVIQY